MDLPSLLANERRARLAAERLLEMRQRDLRAANRKLADHARALSGQIMEKRGEMETIRSQTASLRGEFDDTCNRLEQATTAADLAETRLWAALQSVTDGFALFDSDDRLVLANRAYLSVFDGMDCVKPGISYADLVDVLLAEGIIDPGGDPNDWRRMMLDRWRQTPPDPIVVRLWNGQIIKLVDRVTPDGGKVSLGVNQTAQLRMWAGVEAIPDGFTLFDQEDRLVMCNQRYRDLYDLPVTVAPLGITFEDMLRIGLGRGAIEGAVGREEEWLEERIAEHRRADRQIDQKLSDGRWVRIMEKATPDGGRVALRVDITEIKQHQAALEAERARAEAASRAKSAFLANMSHEIRTPLNGVVGMAELLKSSPLSSEQALFVDTIKSSGEALLQILNDILDFSRIEAQKMPLREAPFDLPGLVEQVVRLLNPSINDRPITLLTEIDPAVPLVVMGDAGRIRQILTNLVGNALKFTARGHVRVIVTPDGPGQVSFRIEDTGIGIPADRLEHVFGEFNQVEDDRNRRFDGTGLGLAISRQLARLMGGEISISSVVGRGSCFAVTLPLAAAQMEAPAGLEPEMNGAVSGTSGVGVLRVLAAEDNRTNRLVLCKMLKDSGIDLHLVEDGTAAVAAFCADPPGLIFMDISMPGMDGREAARQIRAHEAANGLPRTPMVAMTAHAMDSDKVEIFAAGIDYHLSKPLSREALLRHIETARRAQVSG